MFGASNPLDASVIKRKEVSAYEADDGLGDPVYVEDGLIVDPRQYHSTDAEELGQIDPSEKLPRGPQSS